MGHAHEGKRLHRKTVGRLKGTTGIAKPDIARFDQVVWSDQKYIEIPHILILINHECICDSNPGDLIQVFVMHRRSSTRPRLAGWYEDGRWSQQAGMTVASSSTFVCSGLVANSASIRMRDGMSAHGAGPPDCTWPTKKKKKVSNRMRRAKSDMQGKCQSSTNSISR